VRALQLGDGASRVIDVATGTGDLAIEIARRHGGAHVVGVDPSTQMLAVGRKKLEKRGLADRVELFEGDAQSLGFADDSFDGATIAFGIRNVPDRARGLAEMARVVKPGARVCVLELSEPKKGIIAPFARFHVHVLVPRIGALLSGAKEYRYLQTSIEAFPAPAAFAAMMETAGLEVEEARPLTFGVCHLYVGRKR
jgi:demethylmenaquinone methyltransferase/2-methoxy-6-polyprenyl-1,4-benzoquinol methylase